MLPRALLLLAIPSIACGGRSDILDVPASAGPCSMTVQQADTDTSVPGTIASAEISSGETPSILVDCQGSAGDMLYELAGQYEPGQDTMQATWSVNGLRTRWISICTVGAQLNEHAATPGESYGVGEPFAITFRCPIDVRLLTLDNVQGTLSAPLTPH